MEERLLKCSDSAEMLPLPLYPATAKEVTYRFINHGSTERQSDIITVDSNSNNHSTINNTNNDNSSISYSNVSSSNREWTKISSDLMCCSEIISNNISEDYSTVAKSTLPIIELNDYNVNTPINNNNNKTKSNTAEIMTTTTTTAVTSSENSFSVITPVEPVVTAPTMRDWVKRATTTRSPTKQPRIDAPYPALYNLPTLIAASTQCDLSVKEPSSTLIHNTEHSLSNNNKNNNNTNSNSNNKNNKHYITKEECSLSENQEDREYSMADNYGKHFCRYNSDDEDVADEMSCESMRDSLASSFAASLTPHSTPTARRKLSVSRRHVKTPTRSDSELCKISREHCGQVKEEEEKEEEKQHKKPSRFDLSLCSSYSSQSCISTLSESLTKLELEKALLPSTQSCKEEEYNNSELTCDKEEHYIHNETNFLSANDNFEEKMEQQPTISSLLAANKENDHERLLLNESLRCSEASASLGEMEDTTELIREHEHQQKHDKNCVKDSNDNNNSHHRKECSYKTNEYVEETWLKSRSNPKHKQEHSSYEQQRQQQQQQEELQYAKMPLPFFTPTFASPTNISSPSFSPHTNTTCLSHSSSSSEFFARSNSVSRYHSLSSMTSFAPSTGNVYTANICDLATPLTNWQHSCDMQTKSWQNEEMQLSLPSSPLISATLSDEHEPKPNRQTINSNIQRSFSALPPVRSPLSSSRPMNVNRQHSLPREGVSHFTEHITKREEEQEQEQEQGMNSVKQVQASQSVIECNEYCTWHDKFRSEVNKANLRSNSNHYWRYRRNVSPSLARPSDELLSIKEPTNTCSLTSVRERTCPSQQNDKIFHVESIDEEGDNNNNDNNNDNNNTASINHVKSNSTEEELLLVSQNQEALYNRDEEPIGRASILTTCSPLEDEPQIDEVHYLLEQMKSEEADNEALQEEEANALEKRILTLSQCTRDAMQTQREYNNPIQISNNNKHYDKDDNNWHYNVAFDNAPFAAKLATSFTTKSASNNNTNKLNYLELLKVTNRATSSPPMRDRSLAPAELLAERALRIKTEYNHNAIEIKPEINKETKTNENVIQALFLS